MFCPECGMNNPDHSVFCEGCGTKLNNAGTTSKETVKKVKKPMNKRDKFLLIELGVMVLSLLIAAAIYQVQFSAKTVAERYMKSIASEDWSTLYDTILIEKSGDFMTKEAFVTAMTVNSVEEEKDDIEVKSVTKRSGGFSSQKVSVRYAKNNSAEKLDLTLKRDGLFWKVKSDDVIMKEYKISVPAGTTVSVDKINVSETVKASHETKGMDTYTLSPVFGPLHYVELSGKEIETTGQLVYWSEGDPKVVRTSYKKETMEALSNQAADDLEAILNGAAANQTFGEIPVLRDMAEPNQEEAIEEYAYLKDTDFEMSNSSFQMERYTLSNGEVYMYTATEGEVEMVEIVIQGEYDFSGINTNWSEEGVLYSDVGQCQFELIYMKDGGQWKLYSFMSNPFWG